MNKVKINHQKLTETKKAKDQESFPFPDQDDVEDEVIDVDGLKTILQEDPNIFLLNNILMSVQFFENYERDIKILRENFYKEFSIESHHKKCFYVDSLFRLVGENVKFSPRHGPNKNSETHLHPCRIYITSDNVEASFDPSELGSGQPKLWPQYKLQVKCTEKSEKSGFISLVEFKTLEAFNAVQSHRNNFETHRKTEPNRDSIYTQRKSTFEEKPTRRLTKTEKVIALQNKELNTKMLERSNLKRPNYTTPHEGIIPSNGFYKFSKLEEKSKPETIRDFRMNSSPTTSHEIPLQCFQREEVKQKINSRKRSDINECFKAQNVLNSAAFKGYFCDLLIERLSEPLNLDFHSVNLSSILEEFIMVKQKEIQYYITPAVVIRDWNKYVAVNKRNKNIKENKQLLWPSEQMRKIMNILPCIAVATGSREVLQDLDYEKTWKLVFPKTEEFLLLHMMHAHIRCYVLVLAIYKSFIETEINIISLGPKHLMHLLFWRVQKNFFGWPEDKPGETLLNYLKMLYKKLQNKCLCDFFITSRNLFADSHSRDLHKSQVLIKRIIENPIPYIIGAIRNLKFDPGFYPILDTLKLNTILTPINIPESTKKTRRGKNSKRLHFEDEEQRWKKNAILRIELEKKAEEEARTSQVSVDSINTNDILNFDSRDLKKCNQILRAFVYHFVAMTRKSLQYNFLTQALFYLHETRRLFELAISKNTNQDNLKTARDDINKLKETCYSILERDLQKSKTQKKGLQITLEKREQKSEDVQSNVQQKQKECELNSRKKDEKKHSENNTEDGILTIKL